jgi:hypothetical protein
MSNLEKPLVIIRDIRARLGDFRHTDKYKPIIDPIGFILVFAHLQDEEIELQPNEHRFIPFGYEIEPPEGHSLEFDLDDFSESDTVTIAENYIAMYGTINPIDGLIIANHSAFVFKIRHGDLLCYVDVVDLDKNSSVSYDLSIES